MFPFMNLPRELRDEIYSYLVPTELNVRPLECEEGNWTITAIDRYSAFTIRSVHNISHEVRSEWLAKLVKTSIGFLVDMRTHDPTDKDPRDFDKDDELVCAPWADRIVRAFKTVSHLRLLISHILAPSPDIHHIYLVSSDIILRAKGWISETNLVAHVVASLANTQIDEADEKRAIQYLAREIQSIHSLIKRVNLFDEPCHGLPAWIWGFYGIVSPGLKEITSSMVFGTLRSMKAKIEYARIGDKEAIGPSLWVEREGATVFRDVLFVRTYFV